MPYREEKKDDDERLRECPFCGGKARIMLEEEDRPDDTFHNIYCTDCGVQFWVGSKSEAIAKWNTRKPMERIVETLEQRKNFYENRMGEGIERDIEDWGSVKSYEDAIEIVKAGGVDE